MIEIALLAITVLVLTLTLGVPLPYCFGAALMIMYFLGDVTMKGMMLWGSQQLGNPVLLAIPLFSLIANYVALREAHQLAPWPAFWATFSGPLLVGLLFACGWCVLFFMLVGSASV